MEELLQLGVQWIWTKHNYRYYFPRATYSPAEIPRVTSTDFFPTQLHFGSTTIPNRGQPATMTISGKVRAYIPLPPITLTFVDCLGFIGCLYLFCLIDPCLETAVIVAWNWYLGKLSGCFMVWKLRLGWIVGSVIILYVLKLQIKDMTRSKPFRF